MPALVDVVKKIIWREKLVEIGDLVIVAVSGGTDSLSLLHLLNDLRGEKELPFSLHVAHLNHGLRGAVAQEDAEFVREEAASLGLPCTVGEVDAELFRKQWRLSPEDAARRLRYRFLVQLARRSGAASIAVGHNRDDQAETVLLNFLRGTGLDGLTGMKFKRSLGEGLFLIRPLLETSRYEISACCLEKGISPREDETNLENHFHRNKLRLELLPLLEKDYNPRLREGLARLAGLLSLDNNFLEEFAEQRFLKLLLEKKPYFLVLNREKLLQEHEAVQNRILRAAVRKLLGMVPREIGFKQIRAVLDLCLGNSPHGRLYFSHGIKVYRSYDRLLFSLEEFPAAEVLSPVILEVPGAQEIGKEGVMLHAWFVFPGELAWPPDEKKEAYLDYHILLEMAKPGRQDKGHTPGDEQELQLTIRNRQPGDSFYPLGAPGSKKLKKYFIEQKVPLEERERIPLVVAGKEIVWVVGKQISHHCRITEGTRKVLVLKIIPEMEDMEDGYTEGEGFINESRN